MRLAGALMEHFLEGIAPLRHWYINPSEKSNKYKSSLPNILAHVFMCIWTLKLIHIHSTSTIFITHAKLFYLIIHTLHTADHAYI